MARLKDAFLDVAGWIVLVAAGAMLASLLFVLRLIPDRERARAEAARKEAEARIAAIKAKIAAAKAQRESEAAAERARLEEEAKKRAGENPVSRANRYINGQK